MPWIRRVVQPFLSANRRSSRSLSVAVADHVGWGMWWIFSFLLLCVAVLAMSELKITAPHRLQVFGTYWSAGWAANHGSNPYSVGPLTWTPKLGGHAVLDLNLNPPAMLPLLQLFALFAPDTAVKVWILFNWLLFCAGTAWLVRVYGRTLQPRQLIWIMLGAATCETLWIAQIYALFFVLALAGWILLDQRRDLAAGIAIGLLAALKPNCAVWPLLLLFAGYRKTAVAAVVSAAATSTGALLLYGPAAFVQWFHAILGQHHGMFPTDVSVTGVATRLGYKPLGEAAAALLLAASCLWAARARPDARRTSGTALLVACLASPLAWYHYILFVAGPLVSQKWGWGVTALMLPFFLPFPFAYRMPLWPFFWMLLIFFVRGSHEGEEKHGAGLPALRDASL